MYQFHLKLGAFRTKLDMWEDKPTASLKERIHRLMGDGIAHGGGAEEVEGSYEGLRKWKFSDI